MNLDIRLDTRFLDNPKTKRLIQQGGEKTLRCLLSLWLWAAMNRPDGNLEGLDKADIDIISNWDDTSRSFTDMLVERGWLDGTSPNGYSLHHWSEN